MALFPWLVHMFDSECSVAEYTILCLVKCEPSRIILCNVMCIGCLAIAYVQHKQIHQATAVECTLMLLAMVINLILHFLGPTRD